MKLLQVGKTKIKYEKKDGSTKTSKVTSAVAKYAKTNLIGKEIKPTFGNNGTIIKLVERKSNVGNKSNFNYGNKGVSAGNNSYKMVERSVLNSVCSLLAGVEGVSVENVGKLVDELYNKAIVNVLKDNNKVVEKAIDDGNDLEDDEELDDSLEEDDLEDDEELE
ncbi:hypothetical protein DRN73_07125 [Candidatus Pacearchaeota archaeon]|nr:MAG: hypothetical protein DRN73_07125 [Candidatus Pacearchaeota archaeon]